MREETFSKKILSSSDFSVAYYTQAGKDYIFIPKSYEPIARVDFSMSDADTGDVLRLTERSNGLRLLDAK